MEGDFQYPHLRLLTRTDSIDYLQNLLQSTSAPPSAMLFFDAMVAFVRLKEQCFSKQISDSGYVAKLADYKKACSLLPVCKFPVKMHLIIAHLNRAPRETG